MKVRREFASDNNAGVHPDIMKAMQETNVGHTIAYGDDPYTAEAVNVFKSHFGEEIEVYFVFNGTAANVLGIKALTDSYHSVICSDVAHLHVDECGAPEKYTGCKLLTVPSPDGKLTPEGVRTHLHGFGFEHHAQPKIISITQSTEMGTVYQNSEIKKLADLAHSADMYLHVDGARIANAAAHLNCGFREMITDTGVDVLSFGGTKNGLMLGEAVVFLKPEKVPHFKYVRKQGMQLGSKMRFISAQFSALLSGDLWLKNARHSNAMARLLAEKISHIPAVKITQPVEANAVFAVIPGESIAPLQEKFFFYIWNETTSEVRWMTAFDTTPQDIEAFVAEVERQLM